MVWLWNWDDINTHGRAYQWPCVSMAARFVQIRTVVRIYKTKKLPQKEAVFNFVHRTGFEPVLPG